ncbi:MAG: hypothetical protein JXI33_05530 [Candidatus Aminicenantes bacterium]|nr:hypothetical protein [Candidatus Aminicenantes bacterium]
MKKNILLIFWLGVTCLLPAMEFMKLSEIKPGMEGEGQTIFKGSTIETFKFKVLGILDKFVSDKNMIIAELFAPELTDGGVIAGMSGSPAYIDGKLIGSVSYGLSNFMKKPIAGITPIEDILKTSEYSTPVANVEISDIKIDFKKESIERVAGMIRNQLVSRMNFSPAKSMMPIKLFSNSRGFIPEAVTILQDVFVPLQNLSIAKDFNKKKLKDEVFTVQPADAVSIPLIRGDALYAATGTVTHVDGNKVYVFGHPFFNLGTVDFPLHRAEIISLIPSYENSFKLAVTRNMVGAVQQDRFSGVQGELGKTPYMIPLKIFLKNRNKIFNLELISHPLLTPTLTYMSLLNALLAEYQEFGFQSIAIRGKIFIENEANVVLEDLFSGTSACDEFSTLVMVINYFLMNNKEKSIKIQKMDFEISGREAIKNAALENVLIDKNAYLPGEPIAIRLYLKNEKGDNFEEQVTIKAPSLKPGSVFYLMAADAKEVSEFDTKFMKSVYFPSKLNSLIRAINNIRKNNRIYLKIFVPSQGLFISGFEYSYLPPSISNVLLYNSISKDQSNVQVSTIAEYQYEIPAAVSGKKIFKLSIKERKNES